MLNLESATKKHKQFDNVYKEFEVRCSQLRVYVCDGRHCYKKCVLFAANLFIIISTDSKSMLPPFECFPSKTITETTTLQVPP